MEIFTTPHDFIVILLRWCFKIMQRFKCELIALVLNVGEFYFAGTRTRSWTSKSGFSFASLAQKVRKIILKNTACFLPGWKPALSSIQAEWNQESITRGHNWSRFFRFQLPFVSETFVNLTKTNSFIISLIHDGPAFFY